MRFGMRRPSLRGMIGSRVSARRLVAHNIGFKAPRGMGVLTNPKKYTYNKVYVRTSFSFASLFRNFFG